jgi:adenosylmethionine-8-amino-7-oxononanoate aminotransferase
MSPSPIWRPFTQHGLEPPATPIARAEGAWLEARDGHRIFDAISSWWVVTHGHRHPKIVAAMQRQCDDLDQVIFAGLTHNAAEETAKALIAAAPDGLSHIFFSDSGSTSVEVALKMALGYFKNRGEARTRIIAMEHAYHGDTVGAMSAGARSVFNASYAPLLFDVLRIPFPDDKNKAATLDALDAACAAGDAAALIVEPLVLGAGGMLIYDAETLTAMRDLCEQHGVLFIADEVMTGFGRTGAMFACDLARISPDIICLAKGLTGGSAPLAATLCRPEIFEAHHAPTREKMFFHSSSYTANPIACAAAAANLQIWKDEPVLDHIAALGVLQEIQLARVRPDARFKNVRRLGTIAAFDVARASSGYLADVALELRIAALNRGVLIRPLGGTIYVMPPYCTHPDDLAFAYDAISDACDEVLR